MSVQGYNVASLAIPLVTFAFDTDTKQIELQKSRYLPVKGEVECNHSVVFN